MINWIFLFNRAVFALIVIGILGWRPSCGGAANPFKLANLNRIGNQWFPYLEWSIKKADYPGNPFDLTAWVTFRNRGSGQTLRTQMFFAGDDVWKFRFTGTEIGVWDFCTESKHESLDGLTGAVFIESNPLDYAKGFLGGYKNKFVREVGENGELDAVLLNIYGNRSDWDAFGDGGYILSQAEDIDPLLDEVLRNGCNAIHVFIIANSWFKFGAKSYDEHRSEVPDLVTFEKLETIITHAFGRGVHVHIWAWGDEQRKWTPIGVGAIKVLPDRRPFRRIQRYLNAWFGRGGINGVADKRLQRYIAARLGPLPGWSMSYGFDLEEWVSDDQVGEWAGYLQEHMGWPHLLMARGRTHPNLSVRSISHYGGPEKVPRSYDGVVDDMEADKSRPHLYEERFFHTRWNYFSMDVTRRHMWWYTMAGGVGGFWGVMKDGTHYPSPEQMRTHKRFWDGRFLLDMERANDLTNGYALMTPDSKHLVFYKEDAVSISTDLSSIPHNLPVVAVDAKKEYREIQLGMLEPGKHFIPLPYFSDWAVAVGSF